MEPARGEITLLLAKWKDGEPSAFEQLMPLVYSHLREVAAAYIKRERNPGELQATPPTVFSRIRRQLHIEPAE